MAKLQNASVRKIRTARRVLDQSGWKGVARLTRDKIDGFVLKALVTRVKHERGLSHPSTIQIEASSSCNLRCPSCSLSREVNPGRNITPDELRSILDRLPFQPGSVSLNGIGEPLINPKFFELVDIIA